MPKAEVNVESSTPWVRWGFGTTHVSDAKTKRLLEFDLPNQILQIDRRLERNSIVQEGLEHVEQSSSRARINLR